ncbi:MAG: hypothetical protein PWR01_2965 [Clostridiales bacterium]|jgi:type II secretory pathway pseudopilin PulG|nr:hypothetical protein [Clostridiales bacterium]MDN5281892.1 hypothetical protein [Candidatus Ozemobacter sp.]
MQTDKRKAFTLVEIIIAAGVLSLFLAAAFGVFFGGQRMGGNAFWTQQVVNRLRNACRHISDTVKQSSYPSTIIYPGQVYENTSDDFKLQYNSKSLIYATETADITGTNSPGTYLMQFPESIPEKKMFETDTAGTIRYHIYSLCKKGKLLYHMYEENNINTLGPDYARSLAKPSYPPAGATLKRSSVIAEDVESVSIFAQSEDALAPITVSITCRYPRGETRRVEQATAVPNVKNLKKASGSGNW